MKWMIETLIMVTAILLFAVVTASYIGKYTCATKWKSFENSFSITTGCEIKVKNNWIPADQYFFLDA